MIVFRPLCLLAHSSIKTSMTSEKRSLYADHQLTLFLLLTCSLAESTYCTSTSTGTNGAITSTADIIQVQVHSSSVFLHMWPAEMGGFFAKIFRCMGQCMCNDNGFKV